MKQNSYRVIIEPDENNTFHAFVPALPGCHTRGETFEEARRNIRDAMSVYVRSLQADGEPVPEDVGVEVVKTLALAA
ncbi:MAG: type II toxin-antitoxin system HicB family antitoxin [Candidatus Liptonbacteria bacterium]|nr:type II toxin-antitoxin system HicB family antitoxin [Candidatus Liptonbacteria bacterium]